MALYVAVLVAHSPGGEASMATWGSWGIHSWQDPAVLATDPLVRSAETTHVLVLAPSSGAQRAHIAGSAIAAVRPDVSVRVETHPLSAGVLARSVDAVAGTHTGPTGVHAAIAAGLAATHWGAWLPTVAKLEKPHPTLGQHVQSWIASGEGFFASHDAPGWVAKLPLAQVDPGRRLPRSEYDCISYGQLPEAAIQTLFAMGLTNRPVQRNALGDAAAVWGTPKAVEFVITHGAAFSPGAPSGYCPVCAEPVWGTACPFCRATGPRGRQHMTTSQGVSR